MYGGIPSDDYVSHNHVGLDGLLYELITWQESAKGGGRWVVVNGELIDISKDKWLATGTSLANISPPLTGRVVDLLTPVERNWNFHKIRATFPPGIAIEVAQTPISWTAEKDFLTWTHFKNGLLTAKSTCHNLKKKEDYRNRGPSSSNGGISLLWKELWKAKVPQKIKMFSWKAHNAVPVFENLKKRRVLPNPSCPTIIKIQNLKKDYISTSVQISFAQHSNQQSADQPQCGVPLLRAMQNVTWMQERWNQVAHRLANLALRDQLPTFWQSSLPLEISRLIGKDKSLILPRAV
ncbi:Reverse transcriptase zinc-binding domain [Sesbania bispinosa]|nr:Reverse transcriptase zinc-binding domain [Sesbania bispinosa]